MTDPHGPAPDIYDPAYVKDVFDRCSGRYIAFSYACSFGFTERWRRQCVAALPVPRSGLDLGYDLMAGTGEAWPHLLKRFSNLGAITAIDISTGMHEHAMARLHQHRAHKIAFIEASDPSGWMLRPLYRFYMTGVLPMIERLFPQGAQDFSMIGQYTANFGDARNFAAELEAAGLQTDYHEYFFGCASGVSGRKPI